MADGRDLAEMVDAEEARVEAELAAEQEAAQLTAEEAEQVERSKRADYHLRRFFEFAGIEYPEEGVMCPTCSMGFVPVEMRYAPGDQQCPICAGVGRTLTGSIVPGNETRVCPSCQGAGYRTVQPEQPVEVATPPSPASTDVWQAPIIPAPPPVTTAPGV